MDKPLIERDDLLGLLEYNPQTGHFMWRGSHYNRNGRAGTPHKCGYREICLRGRRYLEHRLAWFYVTGQWPNEQIDHKNGNRSDNRWSNLRPANQTQQNANCKIRIDNSSGYRGVSYMRRHGRRKHYRAAICVNGNHRTLGWFLTAEEASAAYQAAARTAFGEYLRQP